MFIDYKIGRQSRLPAHAGGKGEEEVENRNEMAKNYEIDDQNRRCSNLNYMH